jgi:hypothetical protein
MCQHSGNDIHDLSPTSVCTDCCRKFILLLLIPFFRWHNPFSCTVVLGLTQPLTEMSTRNISCGVKVSSAQGWQPYHINVLIVLKSGSLNLLEPSRPVQACNGIALPPHSMESIVKICILLTTSVLIQSSADFCHLRFTDSANWASWIKW